MLSRVNVIRLELQKFCEAKDLSLHSMDWRIDEDQYVHSKFCIPKGESIVWRLKLIKKHDIYDVDKLIRAIDEKNLNQLSEKERLALAAEASAIEDFDELEKGTLLTAKLLQNIDNYSDEEVLCFDANAQRLIQFGKLPSEYVSVMRNNFSEYGKRLIETRVAKVRARLALLELLACFDFDRVIPKLIKISLDYLADPIVIGWLKEKKQTVYCGSPKERIKARADIDRYTKAIKGDGRGTLRKLPYWMLAATYEDLSSCIKGFRNQAAGGTLNVGMHDAFCTQHKLLAEDRHDVARGPTAIKVLVLGIMKDAGLIKSSKSYLQIQPYLNKLQKKHYGEVIAGDIVDIIPVTGFLLDYYSRNPDLLIKTDAYAVLKDVRL